MGSAHSDQLICLSFRKETSSLLNPHFQLMPDSINDIVRHVGDTLNTKVVMYTTDLTPHSSNVLDKLLPMIGVILGVGATLLGQYLIKQREERINRLREINLCRNGINTSLTMLFFYLKDLAYLHSDTKLQLWYSENDSTVEGKKKALEEIYNNYKYQNEKETQIYALFSQLSNYFHNYYVHSRIPVPTELSAQLAQLQKALIALEKCEPFKHASDKAAEVDIACAAAITRLTKAYQDLLGPLQQHALTL